MINSLDILASINKSVSIIAKNMGGKNGAGGDADSTAKLSRGSVASDSAPKATDAKAGGLGLGEIKQMISVLGGLPVAVKAVAGLSGKVMKNFENVMISFYEAFHKILKYEFKSDKIKTLNNVNEAILKMTSAVKKAAPLVLLAPIATLGMLLTIPFFAAAGLAMKLLSAMKIDTKGIKSLTEGIYTMTKAALAASALLLVCIGIGVLIQKIGTKPLLYGLAVLGATMLLLVGIILITGLAAKVVKGLGAMDGLKDIMIFTLATMGLVILAATFGLIFAQGKWKDALWGGLIILGLTLITMVGIILIAGLASKIITSTDAFKSLGKIMLFTIFCFGLVIASAFLARFAKKNWKDILLGLAIVGGVMLALIGIAWVAGKLLGSAKKGIIALTIITALAFAVLGLVYATYKVSQAMKDPKVRKDMLITLAFAGGILVAFGALAVAAGALMSYILPGALALGVVIGFALLTLLFINGVVNLIKKREEAGITWKQMVIEVGGIALVATAFGALAAGFSLLLIPVLLALPVIGIVVGFAFAVISIVNAVVNLKKKTDEAGGAGAIVDFIKNGISPILKSFNRKNLSLGIGMIEFFKLMGDIAKIKLLSFGILVAVDAISRIAEISDVVGDGVIRKVISRDKDGNVKYSDWVDPIAVGKTIVGTLSTFANEMSKGFEDVKLKNVAKAAIAMMIIGQIIDPISKFVEMLTAYESDGDGYLRRITFNEKGELIKYPSVDVASVAQTIAGTVSLFVGTLFSEQNANEWAKILYGEGTSYQNWVEARRRRKGIKEMMGILGMVIEPITNFIDVMSNFVVDEDGVLHKLIEDEKEGVKPGPGIDFKKIGTHIAGAVTAFVSSLFDRSIVEGWSKLMYGDSTSIWDFSGRRAAARRSDAIEKMTGILGQVIEPVANFIDVMSSFTVDATGIHKVLYDGKGGWKTGPAIDFKKIGTDIATGVTSFVNALYARDYMESFNGNADSLKNVVGSFNEVIDFINSIAGEEGDITKATKNVNDFYTTISQFNKNLSTLTDKKATEAFNKAKTNINSTDTELKKVTDTFGNFDKTLYKDKQKRIDDINKLAEAFKKIKDNINGMSNDLSSLTNALREISKADVGKIGDVSDAVNRGRGGSGGGGGRGLSSSDVVDAIQTALQGLKFETDAAGASFGWGHNNNSVSTVEAIKVLIQQLSNMDYTISKK